MTRARIEDILRSRQQAWQRRDPQALGAFHSENGIVHSPIFGRVRGRAAITESYVDLFKAFDDWTLTSTKALIDGVEVAQSFGVQATHASEWLGVPPSHRRFEIHGVLFIELDSSGLVKQEHRVYDFTSLLLQVGLLKAKPAS